MSKVSAFIKDESGNGDWIRTDRRRHFGCDHRDGQRDRYNPEREVPIGLDPAQVTHSMWLVRKKPPSPAASFLRTLHGLGSRRNFC